MISSENLNKTTQGFEPSDQINRDVDVENGGNLGPTIAMVSRTEK